MTAAEQIKADPNCPLCGGKGIQPGGAKGKETPCHCIRAAIARAGWAGYKFAKGVATRTGGPKPAADGE